MADTFATSFGVLNYSGMLFNKGNVRTPLSSIIGSKAKTTNHVEFVTGQEYTSNGNGSQPAISESASLTAPDADVVTRSQKTNVTQIFQESVGISYGKQSNMGTLSGINVAEQQANPMSELDFQVAAKIHIVITNCVLRSCSKAIVIGYSYSYIRNVIITNCIIKESNRGICFMCNDTSALVENVRISNMIVDTRVRAGNWWGNGEPIFMMAVKHDYLIPAEQDPHRETDCAIRNVHIDGVTCMGENAMGIYGVDGNIREVELRNIDFTRKPSKNLPLKGNVFDFAPGRVDFEVPEDCGLYIGGGADVKLENINTRAWKIIHA